jgi:uncharacterized membrane protein YeaQ/YmgE (transglycosylase-associated protein family)
LGSVAGREHKRVSAPFQNYRFNQDRLVWDQGPIARCIIAIYRPIVSTYGRSNIPSVDALVGTGVEIWITLTIGAVIGIAWRRVANSHTFGFVSDMLLGITGAFGARWMLDILSQIGVYTGRYDIVFILIGAGLIPWCYHGVMERRSHRSKKDASPENDASLNVDVGSPKTRAPAA